MGQPTFADLEYQGKKRKTRRELFLELFLERMDGLIPWQKLEERIRRPVYPKPGKGRRAYPLLAMLRIHCVQLFYNLSDPGMEDLLCEGPALRGRIGQAFCGSESDGRPDGRPDGRDHHPQLPPPPGAAPTGPRTVGGDQRPSGVPGTAVQGGDDCGCQHRRGAVLDEEPVWGAGPGDAPDQEREPRKGTSGISG